MTYKEELYPNQPLKEVIFEIRFPGELRVECERHLFWEKIRNDYPDVLVPRPLPDQAKALMPYRFRKSDNSMSVQVCMRSLAISAKKYPGFKEFSKEVLRIYEIFGSTFRIDKLNRIGWRYINVIPFVREKGAIPLERLLNLGFKVPNIVPKEFKNINLIFESEQKGGSVITRLQSIEKSSSTINSQEALLLDFDYGKVPTEEQELIFSDVPTYLVEAHKNTRELFEEYITEEYRQYLRGDVI